MCDETVVSEIDLMSPRGLRWVGRENARRHDAVILYVEDNDLLARAVRDALELAGWLVHHFTESYGASVAIRGPGSSLPAARRRESRIKVYSAADERRWTRIKISDPRESASICG
jgi:hypothetical protein